MRRTGKSAEIIERLTRREVEIIRLAGRGLTDDAIANKLGVSRATIVTYWTRLRKKHGPMSRSELAVAVQKYEAKLGLREARHRAATAIAILQKCLSSNGHSSNGKPSLQRP